MAIHDYVISNASGAAVRQDLNDALAAIVSNNSNATAPTTTYAYQWWADTTNQVMKLRNAANTDWITLYQLDGEYTNITLEAGTNSAPSLRFVSDTNTGIYSPGADQVAITTGGTARLYVGSTGSVGIGTSSPGALLTLAASVPELRFVDSDNSFYGTITAPGGDIYIDADKGNGAGGSIIRFAVDDSERARIDNSGNFELKTAGATIYNATSDLYVRGGSGAMLRLGSNNQNDKMVIDSSGRVLVGTSTSIASDSKLQVKDGAIHIYHASSAASAGYDLRFSTDGGATARTQAAIGCLQATNNQSGGILTFSTTPDGQAAPVERLRIKNTGLLTSLQTDGGIQSHTTTAAASGNFLYLGYHSATTVDNGTLSFSVNSNGNVQNTNGSYTTISDAKLKENIVDANSQWDDLKAIQIRNWNFKEETGHETHRQIGPIAQELETVCPGLVFETPDRDEDGNKTGEVTKGVNQSVLYMKAVKALQEAMERIEQLEAKVAALESA